MNFINISDFPSNDTINYGCGEIEEESYNDSLNETPKCGFCSSLIDKKCHLFSNSGIDYFYLCHSCYQNNVRLCNITLKFFFLDELVQLNQNVLVHYEQDELIELYKQVENKNQLLNIYDIDPNGLDYQEVELTTTGQEM